MSQNLCDDELKYTLIEKHAYTLVKAIEMLRHFILSKHIEVKVPLIVVKLSLSHTLLSMCF